MAKETINWLDWGKKSFEKARRENKPVLLDIHGTWCHWCHVMDSKTYSNEQVIRLVNKGFVPIKADTDRRPDINERYNMGGWPSTVILAHDGTIFDGATYLPPEEMIRFLNHALNYFSSGEQKTAKGMASWQFMTSQPGTVLLDSIELVKIVLDGAGKNFDEYFGGFGIDQKFPIPELLSFLEVSYIYVKNPQIKQILQKTLYSMYEGGLFDNAEYGFYRYSTTRDWSIPHYEKMLQDNSRLIVVYLNAFRLFEEKKLLEAAEKTIEYVLENLFDKKENYFYGSQNADENYYKLSLAKRRKTKKPSVDKTLFTDWNCLMIEALLVAGNVLEKPELEAKAFKCLKTIYKKCLEPSGILHFAGKKESQKGFLNDYCLLVHASLKAFFYSQDKFFLKKARIIYFLAEKKFLDKKDNGFFDLQSSPATEIGLLEKKTKPFRENALMAENMSMFYKIYSEKKFLEASKQALFFATKNSAQHGIFAAAAAEAALKLEKGFYSISAVFSGKNGKSFLRNILYNDFNNLLLFAKEGRGETSATVCVNNACIKTAKQFSGLGLYEEI